MNPPLIFAQWAGLAMLLVLPGRQAEAQDPQPSSQQPGAQVQSGQAGVELELGEVQQLSIPRAPGLEPGPLGAPAAFGVAGPSESWRTVPGGTVLYQQPRVGSPEAGRLMDDRELAVVEDGEGWALVRYEDRVGWLPTSDAVKEVLAGRTLDPELLETARRHLISETFRSIGPFQLYTDLEAPEILASLERLAEQLPAVFAKRYGLEMEDKDRKSALVLFASRQRFETFLSAIGWGSSGIDDYTSNGLAVSTVAEGLREEVEILTLRALTRLLVMRVPGSPLPLWLEDGLAFDMGFSKIGRSGELDPTTWRNGRTRVRNFVPDSGGERSFEVFQSSLTPDMQVNGVMRLGPSRPEIWEIFGYSTDVLSGSADGLTRTLRGLTVRFFLAREARAQGFREMLAGATRGELIDDRVIAESFGTDLEALEVAFGEWLNLAAKETRPFSQPILHPKQKAE